MLAKALQSATAAAPKVYVEDVFSTYLYTGNGSTQTITNGIDLAGEGGLVWLKSRSATTDHQLFDTARGATKELISNSSAAEATDADTLTAFNADGFSLDADSNTNTNAATYASWTFRKQAKFFDVVTYTGTGTTQAIPHNLGSVPGMYICKSTSASGDWNVYHRGLSGANYYIKLNSTDSEVVTGSIWNSAAPTATEFYVGNNNLANTNGVTYVTYLFAHDAGGFGDDGTESVIKCGSFTGPTTVNLGWEPQWVLIKRTDSNGSWFLLDTMRGFTASTTNPTLFANSTGGDSAADWGWSINATGFSGTVAASYIYIAIRRGPMKTPTDATKVFNAVTYTGTGTNSRIFTGAGFPVDAAIIIDRPHDSGYPAFIDRVRGGGNYLVTVNTAAESTGGYNYASRLDSMDGYTGGISDSGSLNKTGLALVNHYFRRAPGFFDVVAYTGDGSAVRTVTHNLGVAPELMIIKSRSNSDATFSQWAVGGSAIQVSGANRNLFLNATDAVQTGYNPWNSTLPTSTVFTLSDSALVNASTQAYIAYLFATCPGVSKVGSYTGTGTTLNIDCGFTAGARFVMIKRTDSTGSWYVWDTARGIVSGNDPYLLLNSVAAEVTSTDYIDPLSSGFQISSTAPAAINNNGGSFIFFAVA